VYAQGTVILSTATDVNFTDAKVYTTLNAAGQVFDLAFWQAQLKQTNFFWADCLRTGSGGGEGSTGPYCTCGAVTHAVLSRLERPAFQSHTHVLLGSQLPPTPCRHSSLHMLGSDMLEPAFGAVTRECRDLRLSGVSRNVPGMHAYSADLKIVLTVQGDS
jgi:hypothetical protein